MQHIKNLLKSDTPTSDTLPTTGTTGTSSGTPTGQGSHFPGTKTAEEARDYPGQSSATATSQPYQSTSSATDSAYPGTGTLNQDRGTAAVGQTSTYNSQHLARGDPTGSVVDPQSTDPLTYKRPESGLQYQGTNSGIGDAGVTSGAATAAATTAFSHDQQRKSDTMPGAFPSSNYENPYKATNLDPRVDGGKRNTSTPTGTTTSSAPSHRGRDAALGTGAGAGAGALAGSEAYQHRQTPPETARESTGPSPSTTTPRALPTDTSSDYTKAAGTRMPDSAMRGDSTPLNSTPATSSNQPGIFDKMLGAVGLGSTSHDNNLTAGEHGRTSSSPTTTTGTSSHTSPTQQGPPKHYRRESIPTTAYPSGTLDSPRAVAPPSGTLSSSAIDNTHDTHTGRDAALGTAGVGAVLGAHELGRDRGLGESSDYTSGTGPTSSGFGTSHGTSNVPSQAYGDSQGSGYSSAAQPSTTTGATTSSDLRNTPAYNAVTAPPSKAAAQSQSTGPYSGTPSQVAAPHGTSSSQSTAPYGTTSDRSTAAYDSISSPPTASYGSGSAAVPSQESHHGRDAALAGTGIAAAGTGAYGLHEHKQHHEPSTTYTISGRDNTPHAQSATTGTAIPDRTRDTATGRDSASHGTPMAAIAEAPGRYPQQDYTQRDPTSSYTNPSTTRTDPIHREDDHTGRNTALGVGAGAAALGGGAYGAHELGQRESGAPYTETSTSRTDPTASRTDPTTSRVDPTRREEDHTGRNAALGAGAGAAAGAYGAHEISQHEAEKQAAKQQAAQEKELQRQQKAAAKDEKHHQKDLEKQESHHQKEAEKAAAKQQKHHEKELEKEQHEREKAALKHQHELEKEEQRRKKALEEEEEARHIRNEKAALVGTAGAGAGGAAAYEAEKDRPTTEHAEKEKKPSIFKRIFKRRQNKDTGIDEEYSTDEEDTTESHVPHHHSEKKGHNVLGAAPSRHSYEEVSGGAQKPSYNPFKKDEHMSAAADHTGTSSTTHPTGSGLADGAGNGDTTHHAGNTLGHDQYSSGSTLQTDPHTGLQYDPSKDTEAAGRLSHVPGSSTGTHYDRGTDGAPRF